MSYFVYILYNPMLDRFYVGSTQDLEDRIARHNQGRSKATKAGAPHWQLKYTEHFESLPEARRREAYIKRMKSRIYIQKLIELGG